MIRPFKNSPDFSSFQREEKRERDIENKNRKVGGISG